MNVPPDPAASRRPVIRLAATCACGAIRLAVDGEVRSMLLCSCLACQQATGTGHAAVALVGADAISIEGTPKSFARPADSGAVFTRWFCPECGTPLHGHSSRAPTLVMLPVGLFGTDSAWFTPGQLIFARSHHQWDTIAADLPRHETYRQGGTRDV
ncbi:MAG: GFA family protein [Devosia sp.]|nr:GFA family protein [Devosia sp.]